MTERETGQPDRWALVVRGSKYGDDAVLAEFDSVADLWVYYRSLSESARRVLWTRQPDHNIAPEFRQNPAVNEGA